MKEPGFNGRNAGDDRPLYLGHAERAQDFHCAGRDGHPYTAHAINIGKGEQIEPRLSEDQPEPRIPAIVDRDTGIRMMESGAILLYLAQKTGKLMPAGDKATGKPWNG